MFCLSEQQCYRMARDECYTVLSVSKQREQFEADWSSLHLLLWNEEIHSFYCFDNCLDTALVDKLCLYYIFVLLYILLWGGRVAVLQLFMSSLLYVWLEHVEVSSLFVVFTGVIPLMSTRTTATFHHEQPMCHTHSLHTVSLIYIAIPVWPVWLHSLGVPVVLFVTHIYNSTLNDASFL